MRQPIIILFRFPTLHDRYLKEDFRVIVKEIRLAPAITAKPILSLVFKNSTIQKINIITNKVWNITTPFIRGEPEDLSASCIS
jgi:hypothetical protein